MSTAAAAQRLCDLAEPEKVTAGLDALVDRGLGLVRRRRVVLTRLCEEAERIDALGERFRTLSSEALQARMRDFRAEFPRGPKRTDPLVPEAFAAAREAIDRQTGMRPFFVQLVGALALHRGFLAEMATGEGKSLTAALAAILAGWSQRPCHVVTVNDYLAERDARNFASLYEFCGLRAGFVIGDQPPAERARGHAAQVTYTTSKELLADFLRDRLCLGEKQTATRWMIEQLRRRGEADAQGIVLRGLHTAIVDEADSVLIDEAVTPLIISGSAGNDAAEEAFHAASRFANGLVADTDYRVERRHRELELLPAGLLHLEAFGKSLPGLWRAAARKHELVEQALHAREFFLPGQQYVVQDGKVVIVDEFTGRLMPMRKWRHGLHQAIEAKEGVEVSALDETLARMSFQRFFRRFRRLSGMTGTAQEAAGEFWHIYRLPVVKIPTHRPCQRRELPDRYFATQAQKWTAVEEEIVRLHATGRPLLIGTRNVAVSEMLAERLAARDLLCQVLNATRHSEEAAIIARAGERGRITIATNMAGRGTDISLGAGVAEPGGLHVLGTERHESGRIDRQLYGRAARQGDPGSAQSWVSAEDELLVRFAGPWRRLVQRALQSGWPGSTRLAQAVFSQAQSEAQRMAFSQRKQVLKLDSWLAEALSFAAAAP